MEYILVLIIAALLGLITGSIARSKGREYALWWFYGFMIFIVALPHSLIMKPLPGSPAAGGKTPSSPAPAASADELTKFAALRDQGVLTEEEFQIQKARILASITPSIITGRV